MEDRAEKGHEVAAAAGASNKSISVYMETSRVSEEKYIVDSRNEAENDSGNEEEAREEEMEDDDTGDDWNWEGCDDMHVKINLRLCFCIFLHALTFFPVLNKNILHYFFVGPIIQTSPMLCMCIF